MSLPVIAERFFKPVETNKLELLFKNYDAALKNIKEVSAIMLERDLSYFYGAHNVKTDTYNVNLFDFATAKKYMDAQYWAKALKLTDVIEFMPATRKEEWNEQIRKNETPPFEPDAVYETLKKHLADRPKYLAERVDNLFKSLSRSHVTNQPEGFKKRIILADVFDGWGMSNYQKRDTIHDLRIIANKFQGRESITDTASIINACRRNTGQWFDVDGGMMRFKAFIKGTFHIELAPEVAWELNQCLHFLYPAAIPEKHRKPQKEAKVKRYKYHDRFIAPATLGRLAEMASNRTCRQIKGGYNDSPQVIEILLALGATIGKSSYKSGFGGKDVTINTYNFDYDVGEVIDRLIADGQMPDKVSYQFYPTPTELAGAAAKILQADDSHACLEPSAGHGALAEHMPKDTLCLELSPLHCEILSAKGQNVECCDFLEHKGEYDRILMNPPFSEGRAKAHIEHARSMLKQGGRLVAIAPASLRGKLCSEGFDVKYSDDIRGAFVDASVTVIFVTIDKH